MRAWRIGYSLVALLAMFGIATAEPVLLECASPPSSKPLSFHLQVDMSDRSMKMFPDSGAPAIELRDGGEYRDGPDHVVAHFDVNDATVTVNSEHIETHLTLQLVRLDPTSGILQWGTMGTLRCVKVQKAL